MTTLLEPIKDRSKTTATLPEGPMRRLLLIAYNFPPVGGAGVQRPVKWVKHLRQFGWDVTVLTTENPSVPARDESLLADIPSDVSVVRARTWEPDYGVKQGLVETTNAGSTSLSVRLKSAVKNMVKRSVKLLLQPDPQVLWVHNAIRAGRNILRERRHDAILVTAPAYSSFFIGTSLKRSFALPLILDFRDEWDMSGRYLENAQRDWFSSGIQSAMQRFVLKRADAVVATTKASTANLGEKLIRLKRPNVPAVTVYNGFDSEDFGLHSEIAEVRPSFSNSPNDPGIQSASQDAVLPAPRFRLLYTGTLWNLTTIEPLVQAVLQLQSTDPDLVARLELVCVGRKTDEQKQILDRLKSAACRFELIDYCQHAKVLEWLHDADAVCLLLSDVPGAERVVPAKLFEYLAIRKEMLAIVPQGETADIVRRFFPAGPVEPKNISGIADWLKQRLAGVSKSVTKNVEMVDLEEFSRVTQTRRLAETLDQLVSTQPGVGRPTR